MASGGGRLKFEEKHPLLWSALAVAGSIWFASWIFRVLRDGRFTEGKGSKAMTITRVDNPIQFWTALGLCVVVWVLVVVLVLVRLWRWARKGRS
jgi:hypothetical protein